MHRHHTEDEADRLIAATMYLMSCHARSRCPRLACMVRRHLSLIGRHPAVTEGVRDMAHKMACAWKAILEYDERADAERAAGEPQQAPAVH